MHPYLDTINSIVNDYPAPIAAILGGAGVLMLWQDIGPSILGVVLLLAGAGLYAYTHEGEDSGDSSDDSGGSTVDMGALLTGGSESVEDDQEDDDQDGLGDLDPLEGAGQLEERVIEENPSLSEEDIRVVESEDGGLEAVIDPGADLEADLEGR